MKFRDLFKRKKVKEKVKKPVKKKQLYYIQFNLKSGKQYYFDDLSLKMAKKVVNTLKNEKGKKSEFGNGFFIRSELEHAAYYKK